MNYVGSNRNTTIVVINLNDDISGSQHTQKMNLEFPPVTVNDMVMKVMYRIGDTIEHD